MRIHVDENIITVYSNLTVDATRRQHFYCKFDGTPPLLIVCSELYGSCAGRFLGFHLLLAYVHRGSGRRRRR